MAQFPLPKPWDDKNGGDLFSSLHQQIDKVFADFHNQEGWPFGALTANNGKMAPSVNMSETDKCVEVTAELPGVKEKDIDVSLTDTILSIKAEKKSETEKEEKDYSMVERRYGSYERSIQLPCDVKDDKVAASFKDGVLTIKLPKSPEAAAKTKKIALKAH